MVETAAETVESSGDVLTTLTDIKHFFDVVAFFNLYDNHFL